MNILLPYYQAITLLGIYPKDVKTYVHTKTHTKIFIVYLFIIAKTWKQPRCPWMINKLWYIQTLCVRLFVTSRTVAYQASQSMGFSRQEYWSGLPSPSPGDLSYLGTEPTSPVSPALQVDSLPTGNSLPGRSHVLYLSQGIPWLRR